MKKITFISFATLFAVMGSSLASANPILKSTMKNLAKDFSLISEPVKKAGPEVANATIYNAIVHTRTAAFQLQLIADRKATEFFPPAAKGLGGDELKEKLGLYGKYLMQGKMKLADIERELILQVRRPKKGRDFAGLQILIREFSAVIGQAHATFKPKN